jgi:hypothetical protein
MNARHSQRRIGSMVPVAHRDRMNLRVIFAAPPAALQNSSRQQPGHADGDDADERQHSEDHRAANAVMMTGEKLEFMAAHVRLLRPSENHAGTTPSTLQGCVRSFTRYRRATGMGSPRGAIFCG